MARLTSSSHDEETAPLSASRRNDNGAATAATPAARTGSKWLVYLFFCVAFAVALDALDIFRPLNSLFKPEALPVRQVGDTVFPIDWSKEDDPSEADPGGDYGTEDLSENHPENQNAVSQTEPTFNSYGNYGSDGGFFPVDDSENADTPKYWPVVADEHWSSMPRIFYPWNSTVHWCSNARSYNRATPAGLILVKVHKAASSTLAGVNLRISHHMGRRLPLQTGNKKSTMLCPSRQIHDDSRKYRNRDPEISFMYSSIRDPAQRAMSWIFYTMSNQGVAMTDTAILRRLNNRQHFVKGGLSPKSRFLNEAGAQVGYMHTGEHLPEPLWDPKDDPNKVQNLQLARKRVDEVMQQYDFLVVVERMQESLVVLQLLLGLNTTDILYLSSKLSGDYSYNYQPHPGCHKLTKATISPAVNAHLSSNLWYAQNYQDYVLYKAANRSLDLTIDTLGRTRFNKALTVYQQMMHDAKGCDSEAIFPCSSDGVHQEKNETNCYLSDWGCGFPCLDRRFGAR